MADKRTASLVANTLDNRLGYGICYPTTTEVDLDHPLDTTSDEYAENQALANVGKTLDFILPLVRAESARSVLDVGCGIGTMVKSLLEHGYDAYGTDLLGLATYWARQNLPRERFFVVDPKRMELPFQDNCVDFALTLGVIEHVGTSDGHADRLSDYHDIRRRWLGEVIRVLRPGGCVLIGGPNRNFPIDVAHGPDSRATRLERLLSRLAGRATVHKVWGENFLWGYGDLRRYLDGHPCTIEPISVGGYLKLSRVPRPLQFLAKQYIERLPKGLLGTGFNPWMIALVRKTSAGGA